MSKHLLKLPISNSSRKTISMQISFIMTPWWTYGKLKLNSQQASTYKRQKLALYGKYLVRPKVITMYVRKSLYSLKTWKLQSNSSSKELYPKANLKKIRKQQIRNSLRRIRYQRGKIWWSSILTALNIWLLMSAVGCWFIFDHSSLLMVSMHLTAPTLSSTRCSNFSFRLNDSG